MNTRVTRYDAPRTVTPGRRFSPAVEAEAERLIAEARARLDASPPAAADAPHDDGGDLSPAAALAARTHRHFDEARARGNVEGMMATVGQEELKDSIAQMNDSAAAELNARTQNAWEARRRANASTLAAQEQEQAQRTAMVGPGRPGA